MLKWIPFKAELKNSGQIGLNEAKNSFICLIKVSRETLHPVSRAMCLEMNPHNFVYISWSDWWKQQRSYSRLAGPEKVCFLHISFKSYEVILFNNDKVIWLWSFSLFVMSEKWIDNRMSAHQSVILVAEIPWKRWSLKI